MFTNRGYLGKQYSQDTPVSEHILEKMPSSRKEQNRQNWGIMVNIGVLTNGGGDEECKGQESHFDDFSRCHKWKK